MANFDKHQKKYYTTEINRSIPTRAQVDDATLSLALGDVDPEMPGPNSGNRRAKETASFLSTFGTTNNLAQRDSLCASYASPSPAMRDAAARTGCGWWYVPDSRGHSVGAYGTRRGPMNTQIDSQVGNGEWIWNLDDAARRESTKLTHKIKSCADIDFYKKQNPNIGWCATMGTAVVVDQYGRPAFPKAPGGYCPEDERIIMNSADCPIPEPPSATDPGSTQGNAGISWLCSQSSGGSLSPQCLKAVTEVYCSSNGTLAQALSNGYPSSSSNFNNANRYLVERGFELNPGLVNGGATTLNAALNSVAALRQLANSGEPSLSTGAAANMCYGYRFNPCDVRSDKTQPYDQHCIRTVALNMGYGQNGALLSKGGDFWNKMPMWKDVIATLAHWKQLADSGPDPTKQTEAIRMVYGIDVKYPELTCTEFMMTGNWMGYDLPIDVVKNLPSGERVYIAQDQEYVKMVSESGPARYFVGSISQFDPNKWNSYADVGRNYVIQPANKPRLYQNYNFAGGARGPAGVEFDVGSYPFSRFTAMIPNDSVSSIYIPKGYSVTIYQGDLTGQWGWPNFPRTTLTSSVKDLRSMSGYDKTISAIEVTKKTPVEGTWKWNNGNYTFTISGNNYSAADGITGQVSFNPSLKNGSVNFNNGDRDSFTINGNTLQWSHGNVYTRVN